MSWYPRDSSGSQLILSLFLQIYKVQNGHGLPILELSPVPRLPSIGGVSLTPDLFTCREGLHLFLKLCLWWCRLWFALIYDRPWSQNIGKWCLVSRSITDDLVFWDRVSCGMWVGLAVSATQAGSRLSGWCVCPHRHHWGCRCALPLCVTCLLHACWGCSVCMLTPVLSCQAFILWPSIIFYQFLFPKGICSLVCFISKCGLNCWLVFSNPGKGPYPHKLPEKCEFDHNIQTAFG